MAKAANMSRFAIASERCPCSNEFVADSVTVEFGLSLCGTGAVDGAYRFCVVLTRKVFRSITDSAVDAVLLEAAEDPDDDPWLSVGEIASDCCCCCCESCLSELLREAFGGATLEISEIAGMVG
jgi:hypothetical protein